MAGENNPERGQIQIASFDLWSSGLMEGPRTGLTENPKYWVVYVRAYWSRVKEILRARMDAGWQEQIKIFSNTLKPWPETGQAKDKLDMIEAALASGVFAEVVWFIRSASVWQDMEPLDAMKYYYWDHYKQGQAPFAEVPYDYGPDNAWQALDDQLDLYNELADQYLGGTAPVIHVYTGSTQHILEITDTVQNAAWGAGNWAEDLELPTIDLPFDDWWEKIKAEGWGLLILGAIIFMAMIESEGGVGKSASKGRKAVTRKLTK